MSRPSLRITRHDDQDPPGQIVFEVWNPLAIVYEPMDTLDTGLFRLTELIPAAVKIDSLLGEIPESV